MNLLYDMVDVEIANKKAIAKSEKNICKVLPVIDLWIFLELIILRKIYIIFQSFKHYNTSIANQREQNRVNAEYKPLVD